MVTYTNTSTTTRYLFCPFYTWECRGANSRGDQSHLSPSCWILDTTPALPPSPLPAADFLHFSLLFGKQDLRLPISANCQHLACPQSNCAEQEPMGTREGLLSTMNRRKDVKHTKACHGATVNLELRVWISSFGVIFLFPQTVSG